MDTWHRLHTIVGPTVLCLAVLSLTVPLARALPTIYTLRFSDVPVTSPAGAAGKATAAQAPAKAWFEQHGWQQVWPPTLFGTQQRLFFAGPPEQRYLRVYADKTFYILTRQVEVSAEALPWLSITWGIERFPTNAALDLYGRNDRPLAVLLSFGERVGSPGLLPNVPRALAFFWGETEQVGQTYTCVTPRNGPEDARLQCKYPHVKYIALRRGAAGSVHTDRVNLLEHFQQQFPDYWQEHQRVPPVVALSFEASSGKTGSISRTLTNSVIPQEAS
ncbi:MAG: DUF3047 domain-containing protein [Candidatus Tectomicrobia bacterium]|uniref:DUF3047 domain-containing protein n=1 Tax=Tectimicrobiota bacterium TaxID=2528274 RepID=A0A937W2L9_UNCTE|nr:DUF3047 domain-containing protein [Candidatus Tectomicrobia bacterium]